MFTFDQTLVLTPADLAEDCEYGLLQQAAGQRRRARPGQVSGPADAPAAHASPTGRARGPARGRTLGERIGAHARVRRREAGERLRAETGGRITTIARADRSEAGLRRQHEETLAALRAGASIVAGATFFDGELQAGADYLEATATGYRIHLVTTARSTRVKDVVRAGAVAAAMRAAGIEVAAELAIDSIGGVSHHSTADAALVARSRRARLARLLARETVPEWGDPAWWACGFCPACRHGIEEYRDTRLVWGLRRHHHAALAGHGVHTIEELADLAGPIEGLEPADLVRLRGQARLQLRQERAEAAGAEVSVFAEVFAPAVLARLPEPSPGDVFFDFEGDPWFRDGDEWGLEYLFGFMESDTGDYRTFWAHSLSEEKQALVDFLEYLRERRRRHPDLHVYHYAFYEPATLRRLARRHGVAAAEIDDLLAAGVFVDLYDVVKHGVHVSQRSFSLKKLEPLYMGDHVRTDAAVVDGAASVLAYEAATIARDQGDEAGWRTRLAELAEYNEYDCLSTWRLRDWLLDHRRDGGSGGAEHATPTDSGRAARTDPPAPAPGGETRLAAASAGGSPAGTNAAESRLAIEAVAVEHRRRTLTAPEEVAAILDRLDHGRGGGDAAGPRPSLLVVALTDAQAELLRTELAAASCEVPVRSATELLCGPAAPWPGGGARPVPTADHLVVSIVASTLADADGGAQAVLDPRLWCALAASARAGILVVHSDQLLATMPRAIADFGDYAALVRRLEPARIRRA